MVTAASSSELSERIAHIQRLTIGWMTIEAILSLAAAWKAHSPVLTAFGGDSAIELASALVVLLRFSFGSENAERLASRIAGLLLFTLAAFVAAASTLSLFGYVEPKPSFLGVVVLAMAALWMPWLAKEKRKLSAASVAWRLEPMPLSLLCAVIFQRLHLLESLSIPRGTFGGPIPLLLS